MGTLLKSTCNTFLKTLEECMQIANAAFTSELLCRTPPGSPRLAVLKSSKVRARLSSAAAAGVTGAGGRPSVVLHPPLAAARTFFGGLSFVATFLSVLSPPYPVRYSCTTFTGRPCRQPLPPSFLVQWVLLRPAVASLVAVSLTLPGSSMAFLAMQ